MYFDALTMSAVADELHAHVAGGRVQRIVLIDELTLGLEIYAPPRRRHVVVSAHPQLARIHLMAEKIRRGVETHSPLLLLMRKHVREARVTQIVQESYERILRMSMAHPEHGETTLVVEVMGRHSNVVLLDADEVIVECLKRVGADVNRYRVIQPQQPYIPPPPQDKLDPDAVSELWLRNILEATPGDKPLWRALVGGIRGVSPLLARELAFRGYGRTDLSVGEIERLSPLLQQFDLLVRQETREPWQPSVARQEGEIATFAPYALHHLGDYETVDSTSLAVERYTAAQTSRDPYAAAKRRVQSIIDDALRQSERKRYSLERSLRPATELDKLRRSGEWLLAYAYQIEPGQTSLAVEETPGETPLKIAIDPTLTPVKNAQKYFDRYSRSKKAAQEVPPLLKELSLSEQYLDQLLTDLKLASNQPEIEDIRLALEEAGYIKTSRKRAKGGRTKPLSLQSVDGLTILVGKNSRQNDEVTFHRATGEDVWFHARGVPGAHVIVRSGGKPIPESTGQQAAQLAAHFSSARGDKQVAVDYTQQRHVRRIKGGGPGMVTYRHEATLHVEPKGP